MAILGGAAFWRTTPEETEAAFREALTRGVNHLDIAPRYGDAEVLVGPLLEPVRDRLFVAAKSMRPSAGEVRPELERSLERLRTDHLDLYQLHAVTSVDVLDQRAGAVEAITRAREEGLVRFLGITGHDVGAPAAAMEALRRYDLDTVMFPVNPRMWAEQAYRRDAEALLYECSRRDVGVMAIKAIAHKPWTGERFATTWYEPFADRDAIARGVRFALSTAGVHAFCLPGDTALLRTALDAAEGYRPMSDPEREAAVEALADLPMIFPIPAA